MSPTMIYRLISGQGTADLLQSRVRPFRQVPNVQIQILPSSTSTTINYRYYHQVQILPPLAIYTMAKSYS